MSQTESITTINAATASQMSLLDLELAMYRKARNPAFRDLQASKAAEYSFILQALYEQLVKNVFLPFSLSFFLYYSYVCRKYDHAQSQKALPPQNRQCRFCATSKHCFLILSLLYLVSLPPPPRLVHLRHQRTNLHPRQFHHHQLCPHRHQHYQR